MHEKIERGDIPMHEKIDTCLSRTGKKKGFIAYTDVFDTFLLPLAEMVS